MKLRCNVLKKLNSNDYIKKRDLAGLLASPEDFLFAQDFFQFEKKELSDAAELCEAWGKPEDTKWLLEELNKFETSEDYKVPMWSGINELKEWLETRLFEGRTFTMRGPSKKHLKLKNDLKRLFPNDVQYEFLMKEVFGVHYAMVLFEKKFVEYQEKWNVIEKLLNSGVSLEELTEDHLAKAT